MNDSWTVTEAKTKLSEVIDRAQSDGPQLITRKGKKAVVVVDAQEWDRKTKRTGNLAEFLASSPLGDLELDDLAGIARDARTNNYRDREDRF